MRVRLIVVVGALLLGGCGGRADEHPQPGEEPAVPAISSPRPQRSSTPARPPPDPPRGVPTRLVGAPIVLRVEGATHHPLLRYVLIFRLNRPYPKWPKDPKDPDGPAPLPEGAAEPLGNYSIAGFEFDFSRSIFNFDPVDQPDTDNCFFGRLDADMPESPDATPRLDAIPDGGRVRVRLCPLTPDRHGRPAYGPIYVRRPHIITTQVTP